MSDVLKIYTDGGARGNPGPSASAYVVISGGSIIAKGSTFLGVGTNNQAEYKAVINAFEWLSQNDNLLQKKAMINFFIDSELVVRQLNSLYKVKNNELKVLVNRIKSLEKKIKIKVIYSEIPREKNKMADKLVNKTLDNINSN